MNNEMNVCLDWDDVIEEDGQEYVILPEGDYNFVVVDFERGRFPGSAKIPACNKATLTLAVDTEDGKRATAKVDIILCRNLEWRISAFFRCIGQKKHGERLVMNWNTVLGSKGRAKFKPRNYTNKDGEERQANDVDVFYDYDDMYFETDTGKCADEDNNELPFEDIGGSV